MCACNIPNMNLVSFVATITLKEQLVGSLWLLLSYSLVTLVVLVNNNSIKQSFVPH